MVTMYWGNHVTSEDPSSANRNASETEDTKLYNKVEQWLMIYWSINVHSDILRATKARQDPL